MGVTGVMIEGNLVLRVGRVLVLDAGSVRLSWLAHVILAD